MKKDKKEKEKLPRLDTQLFPECEGTKYDRDIVKKHLNKKKKNEKKNENR